MIEPKASKYKSYTLPEPHRTPIFFQIMGFAFDWTENVVGQKGNSGSQCFLLFPHYKPFFLPRVINTKDVLGKALRDLATISPGPSPFYGYLELINIFKL